MHRFYVPELAALGKEIRLPEEAARQCARVLRLTVGETVALFDGSGAEAIVKLAHLEARMAAGIVEEVTRPCREARCRVELWMGMPRQEKWEWALQKGTELGVSGFQPLDTARCVARPDPANSARKSSRWGKIVQEAAEQSGRTVLPSINPVIPIRDAAPGEWGIMLHLGNLPGLRAVLGCLPPPAEDSTVRLLVGPEGGLEDCEVESLSHRGWRPASLGARTLRCETAAITACALTLDHLGDLGTG